MAQEEIPTYSRTMVDFILPMKSFTLKSLSISGMAQARQRGSPIRVKHYLDNFINLMALGGIHMLLATYQIDFNIILSFLTNLENTTHKYFHLRDMLTNCPP